MSGKANAEGPERVVYYSEPLEDDFAGNHIRTKEVGPDFPFVRESKLWNAAAWLLYYVVAIPLAWLIAKLYLGLKFENRRALRRLRHTGFFLYGNHTRCLDAFLPALAAFPKRGYIVANADAVSLPFLQNVVMMLGALPLPTEVSGMRAFLTAVSRRYAQGGCIGIFPEAHVWPFYTGVRQFRDTSFHYAVKENAPVVAMVTTYRKRKGLFRLCRRPGMTVTFSEPIYPDPLLPPKQARADLRDRAFQFMEAVSREKENIAYIEYIYAPPEAAFESS